MTATPAPRISAATVAAAATRLLGTVVLDVADMVARPARYLPYLEQFAVTLEDGEEVTCEDDGTLIVLVPPTAGALRDLIDEHGTPGRAAVALTRELRQVVAL